MIEAFRLLDLPLEKREWDTAAAIIRDVNQDLPIRLMTNNPKKVAGLEEFGILIPNACLSLPSLRMKPVSGICSPRNAAWGTY